MNEYLIYDDIEPGLAREVQDFLEKAEGQAVTIRINSPGGDAWEGTAVANTLRRYTGYVTAVVDSVAASAASVIAVSADELVMARGSNLMIHDAWIATHGNADGLLSMVSQLETESDYIAQVYAEKAGGDPATWRAAMKKETWFTAEEAVQAGLADRIEVIEKAEKVANSFRGSPIMARYRGRREAPPKELLNHTEHREDDMSFKNMADELGTTEEALKNALQTFLAPKNEAVEVKQTVDVTYPEDIKVSPTEKIAVEPILMADCEADSGDSGEVEGEFAPAPTEAPSTAGLTFALGAVADGYEAEVDDKGVVTITAPAGVEVDSTAEFTVRVNDEIDVPLTVTVAPVSREDENAGEGNVEVPAAPLNKVSIDKDTYDELKAAAEFGWQAMENKKREDEVAEVDGWIKDGRISAAHRDKAIKAMSTSPEVARDLYGSNPVNTVPRASVGYSKVDTSENQSKVSELLAKASNLRNKK